MPLFCHPWVHCHCHLSSTVVRYAVFLGKWDFLSVDIMYSRSVQKEFEPSVSNVNLSVVDFKVYQKQMDYISISI